MLSCESPNRKSTTTIPRPATTIQNQICKTNIKTEKESKQIKRDSNYNQPKDLKSTMTVTKEGAEPEIAVSPIDPSNADPNMVTAVAMAETNKPDGQGVGGGGSNEAPIPAGHSRFYCSKCRVVRACCILEILLCDYFNCCVSICALLLAVQLCTNCFGSMLLPGVRILCCGV